ncbi:glycine/D-amino acid oxidase-like deaminating enzyme [Nocardia transvalensis]|uniref:Glycine/D-amino acid oxidase-like deaminating enzyme n=1 Tax=Nocardia transvalensis TaxID=37333 RepID=A0A7W9PA69_9NOCA|nr:FAD-binding oxidoreductase [Nocardia transvalensis]MBB5912205.1 glycine/D-amino acid oxidase-like deaminating enzyme [Nocardia transvalensis]
MKNEPLWWPESGIESADPPLIGGRRDDLVIVGGGLAGLVTAYYVSAARPDLSVVVLEAESIGAGATGRSTGIVSPGLSIPLPRLRRRVGDGRAIEAFDASQHGVTLLRDLIRAERIDCDARDEPHTLVAVTTGERRRMAAHLAALRALDRTVHWLTPAELVDHAGPGYIAGFAYDNAMVVDPYQLVVGLAAVLRERGVAIYENSRVRSIDSSGSRPRVVTDQGSVTAGRVLLTVDGYAGDLGPMATSVVALRTHLLATAPLTGDRMAGLGWTGRGGIIDQRNFFNYYRMTADKRLVFGGGPALVPTGDPGRDATASARVQGRIDTELIARFPALAGVEIEARWSGLTASSTDRLPVVGPVPGRDGVYYAGAWCGHGFAMSVDAGWRFADMLAGGPRPRLPWYRSSAQYVPTRFARTQGVRGYLRYLDQLDRSAQRRTKGVQR